MVDIHRSDNAPLSPAHAPPSASANPLSSLPLFASTFHPNNDFAAIGALIDEEDDEQRARERDERDSAKLRKRRGDDVAMDTVTSVHHMLDLTASLSHPALTLHALLPLCRCRARLRPLLVCTVMSVERPPIHTAGGARAAE